MTTLPHSYLSFLDPSLLPPLHSLAYLCQVNEVNVTLILLLFSQILPFCPTIQWLECHPHQIRLCLHLPILPITILSDGEAFFYLPLSSAQFSIHDYHNGSHWPMPRNPIRSIIEPFHESSHIHNVLYVSEAALLTLSAVLSDIFQFPNKCICRVSISLDWCLGSTE